MLLDIGSKVNGTDLVKETPLHLALRANHAYDIAIQLTSVLLQYGASPTLLGREDDMPLDIARQTGQGHCLELLEAALGENTDHHINCSTHFSENTDSSLELETHFSWTLFALGPFTTGYLE